MGLRVSSLSLAAYVVVAQLTTPGADASTVAQNSAWTVTRPGATQTLRVVAYGDSIFAGYTDPTGVARRAAPYVMAEYCAALLGQNVHVARRCQSGAVASGVYDRINSATDRAYMQDPSTRVVTFEMCGNDYLQARSSFRSASGTCNYTGLETALANCQTFTQLAMQNINTYAHANTRLKIVANLYYPGFDADDGYSTCTDTVNGDPGNGNRVHMQTLFLPLLAESNWWTCKYAADHGFLCADAFALYMASDYDSNADNQIDSDAIRYIHGESLVDYRARIVSLASTLRDPNTKFVTSTSSFDYILSDDTHPTFEGATWTTFFGPPGGDNPVFFATAGPYPDGKNIHWNQNGHDRMGWGLDPACPFVAPACGNGAVETMWLPSGTARVEGCDDGNVTAGDGCSAACGIEPGYACAGTPSMCAPICGDNLITGLEQCDDGNATANDGCSATCTVEPGFSCMGAPSMCQHVCGDGLIVAGEGCDDGDLDAGDGCSGACTTESGWSCAGEPSVCAPICGDALIVGTETCDDGAANGTLPSCCSETCTPQPPGTTCDDGNACTIDTCDGAVTCVSAPRDCDDGNPCTDDTCHPATGCVHTPNTAPCDDGNACTTADTCSAGACLGGPPPDCNDDNGCTDDGCNPGIGCTHTNNTAPCSDGNACTTNDTCAAGACQGGAPPNCNDGNQCTEDICAPATGCANPSKPDGTSCDDGAACTIPDACNAGTCQGNAQICGDGTTQGGCGEQCDDGNVTDGDGCSSSCQVEATPGCDAAPATGCRRPVRVGASSLALRDLAPNAKDSLQWKWGKGATTPKSDFGTPTVSTSYQLCLYDGAGLRASTPFPAGGLCGGRICWKETGSGFKYSDKTGLGVGISSLVLKAGTIPGQAKIQVKSKGLTLALPALPLTQPVTVQLRNSAGLCWEAVYGAPAISNQSDQFKDKSD